jgi:parallel beta-helix repeat protein
MEVEAGYTEELTATVTGGDNKTLTWYVNDIENGNDTYGTISQNSPVTYNAPDTWPGPLPVAIRAVSVADPTKYDSCMVTVTFLIIHVDIETGNDDTGTGYIHDPVKTMHRGMALVNTDGTVLVAPGVYDTDHGETFPLYHKAGVTLEGEDWVNCVIRGSDEWGYAVSLENTGSAIRKFTFESDVDLGQERWEEYVYLRGEDVRADSIRTSQRTYVAPIKIRNATNAIIENCVFEVPYLTPPTSGIGQNRGISFSDGNTGTIIRGCTVSGFRDGIRVTSDSNPLVENCTVQGNDYGINLCCYHSSSSNPTPDLGGGARNGTGGNTIMYNVECGLYNETYNVIFAMYNTWDNDPPVAGEDYCNTSTGGVIVD